jgi:hypothetical protein
MFGKVMRLLSIMFDWDGGLQPLPSGSLRPTPDAGFRLDHKSLPQHASFRLMSELYVESAHKIIMMLQHRAQQPICAVRRLV